MFELWKSSLSHIEKLMALVCIIYASNRSLDYYFFHYRYENKIANPLYSTFVSWCFICHHIHAISFNPSCMSSSTHITLHSFVSSYYKCSFLILIQNQTNNIVIGYHPHCTYLLVLFILGSISVWPFRQTTPSYSNYY